MSNHPDTHFIYRHNWTVAARLQAGMAEETRAETIARLRRAGPIAEKELARMVGKKTPRNKEVPA